MRFLDLPGGCMQAATPIAGSKLPLHLAVLHPRSTIVVRYASTTNSSKRLIGLSYLHANDQPQAGVTQISCRQLKRGKLFSFLELNRPGVEVGPHFPASLVVHSKIRHQTGTSAQGHAMDVALAVVDALRQIYALRKAILRQRRVNEETYLQMMEIFVELHSSEGVQVNATLRRTAAVEKFSEAVIKFSSYLQKYDHMCRVVRLFKLAAMEEERLEIVGEIDQVLRMLNFASAVTVMNGAVAVSRNTARLRAKLEEMHGDIKLGHDQLLAALLAKKKQQHADQGPVLEERSSNRVGVDQVLVHQVSVLTACEGDEQANPLFKHLEIFW